MRPGSRVAVVLLLAAAGSSAGHAQRPSQHGTVTQTIDSTTITLEYDRPVARGRTLYGGVVRWGRTWTPGANWATTIEVDRDVLIEGAPLPKGKYSVWAVPRADEWTIMLSREARRFHTRPPDGKDEQLRIPVRPRQRDHMETLTWYFPVVTPDGATLALQWGTTMIPLRLTVEPSRPAAVSGEEQGIYGGTYRVTPSSPGDSLPAFIIEVTESDGRLRARTEPALLDYDATLDLWPIRARRFLPRFWRGGKLVGAEREMEVAFKVEGGRAVGLEVVWLDRVMAHGERVAP